MLPTSKALLTDFAPARPAHTVPQGQSLDWLARAHARAQATLDHLPESKIVDLEGSMRRRLARFGCSPNDISARSTVLGDFLHDRWDDMSIYALGTHAHGHGTRVRTAIYAEHARAHLASAYAADATAPDDLIHVTCTGYVSPSAPQELVAQRGWATRVTHAYHMGCYASIPAVRLAAGQLALGRGADRRADIVHTELCTLHLDPGEHSAEQLVVQSLFADGLIRYSVRPCDEDGDGARPGLEVLALAEAIIPDSADSMAWLVGDFGMQMTLARDVPDRIGGPLGAFVAGLCARADEEAGVVAEQAIFAVHPGGPKIIDRVAEVLGLAEAQIAASRTVLREHGNMSSATLPHVWARIAGDAAVATGTPIVSLAFGPGLTVCGAVFRKR